MMKHVCIKAEIYIALGYHTVYTHMKDVDSYDLDSDLDTFFLPCNGSYEALAKLGQAPGFFIDDRNCIL